MRHHFTRHFTSDDLPKFLGVDRAECEAATSLETPNQYQPHPSTQVSCIDRFSNAVDAFFSQRSDVSFSLTGQLICGNAKVFLRTIVSLPLIDQH